MKEKKSRIAIISIVVAIITTICLVVSASVENTGGTAEQREDEKSLVRMSAMVSRGNSPNDKVSVSLLEDELDRVIGDSDTTVEETSSDVITVTFVATGNVYEINANTGSLLGETGSSGGESGGESGGDSTDDELPGTAETTPYLPTGFSWANAEHTEILDPSNNQYVWVEVPRNATVYNDLTDDTEDTGMSDISNEDILAFDVNNLTTDNLTAIETELKEYTATYRKGTTYKDEFYSSAQHGFADATAYNNHKNTMLASVFKNGGFYVGKYEAGTTTARTSKNDALTTAVIQANAYPYNYVTNAQAQSLASEMASGGYTTSLMFGLQWDLVLKHLEVSNAASTSELNSNSTEWGNYYDNKYTTNASSKYSLDDGATWTTEAYEKTTDSLVLLSTGASTEFERGGIYDLAGNVLEWTLEYTSYANLPCANRGGNYGSYGISYPASYRGYDITALASDSIGYRVSLY